VSAIYALFSEPDDVQKAVDGLRKAGVADNAITVISSEPIEEYEFSHRHHASWLFPIAAAGGAVGLALATGLTIGTERAWPITTGGMPIVSWWPNIIVMFEMTMLGAILATVVSLFITAKLPSRGPRMYDPAVSDGKILVGVEEPPAALSPAIEQALTAVGPEQLKRS
jgi:hypothetical protein